MAHSPFAAGMVVDLQSMLAKTCLHHASKEVEAYHQDSVRTKQRPFLKPSSVKVCHFSMWFLMTILHLLQ
jgi:hypothetical protein